MTAYALVVTETEDSRGNMSVRTLHAESFAADADAERCARTFIGAHFGERGATTTKSTTGQCRTLGISYAKPDGASVTVRAQISPAH